jgi:hypothetical protein
MSTMVRDRLLLTHEAERLAKVTRAQERWDHSGAIRGQEKWDI